MDRGPACPASARACAARASKAAWQAAQIAAVMPWRACSRRSSMPIARAEGPRSAGSGRMRNCGLCCQFEPLISGSNVTPTSWRTSSIRVSIAFNSRNSFSGTARRRSRRSICSPVRWVRSKRRKGLLASTWRASLPGAPGGAITTSSSSYSGVQRVLAILRPASTRKAASRSPSSTRPASSLALPDSTRTSSFGCAFFRPDTTLDSVPMQDTMLPTDTEPASSPGAVRGRRRRSYMSSSCLASGSSSRPAALRMASRPLRSNSSRPSSVSRGASGS